MKKTLLTLVAAIATLTASAICQGTSTEVDQFYTNADPTHAVSTLTQGFTWQCETVGSSVNVKVTFLDALPGIASPDLFRFDNQGVLIGNPIQMAWDATTRTASYTVANMSTGDKLSFLVKVALEAGNVLFTERIVYKFGDDCSGTGEDTPVASCSGNCKGTDNYYTSIGSFTNGIDWKCATMKNNDVNIEITYLDYFPAMAAPQLFLFHMVDTNEQLDGDPIPMDWTGKIASYTVSGRQTGDQIRFLVMVGYEAGGTIYSERMTYTVGQDCTTAIEVTSFPSGEDRGEARKFIENGRLYIQTPAGKISVLGQSVQ